MSYSVRSWLLAAVKNFRLSFDHSFCFYDPGQHSHRDEFSSQNCIGTPLSSSRSLYCIAPNHSHNHPVQAHRDEFSSRNCIGTPVSSSRSLYCIAPYHSHNHPVHVHRDEFSSRNCIGTRVSSSRSLCCIGPHQQHTPGLLWNLGNVYTYQWWKYN